MKRIEEVIQYIEARVKELEELKADALEISFKQAASSYRAGQFELLRLLQSIRDGESVTNTAKDKEKNPRIAGELPFPLYHNPGVDRCGGSDPGVSEESKDDPSDEGEDGIGGRSSDPFRDGVGSEMVPGVDDDRTTAGKSSGDRKTGGIRERKTDRSRLFPAIYDESAI